MPQNLCPAARSFAKVCCCCFFFAWALNIIEKKHCELQNQKFRLNESWICLGLYCISSSDDSKMSQKFQMTLYFHWWQKWRCWHGSKVEGFFSTLLWFSVPEPWVRTVKYLSFVNQMIQHLFRHINTPWLSLNPCAFFHIHVLVFFLLCFKAIHSAALLLGLSVLRVFVFVCDFSQCHWSGRLLQNSGSLDPLLEQKSVLGEQCGRVRRQMWRWNSLYLQVLSTLFTHILYSHKIATHDLNFKICILYHLLNYFQFQCNLFHFTTLGCDGSA